MTATESTGKRRGQLRVYLGAAPGVGKTFAMLDEGHRRGSRGTDVVAAFVECHGRKNTESQLAGLERIARRAVTYRGATFHEMDLPAVLARAPQVALVDEMAHTNVQGCEHEKRWQDIETLLEAGIDVITTVNIQHLDSLNDVVQAITGIAQQETIPDSVLRAADQIELVDMTPEALRRRMVHGNVYQPDKIDAALSNYFRHGNLTALRELALLWLADRVDEGLQRYREEHGIDTTWETRERVVVALTGGPEGETLIRRAARIAAHASGGDLLAVHIARNDGLAGASIAALQHQRELVESLGGTYHSIVGDDVPNAILDFARANNATQIVVGASRRHALAALLGPGSGGTIIRRSGTIDVHVVTHAYIGKGRVLPPVTGGLTLRRRVIAWVVTVLLLGGLTPLGAQLRGTLSLASEMLLFLLAVVIVSLVGGFWPALAAALASSLLINFFFVPPIHTFTISEPESIFALVAFVIIAASVSRVVDLSARRNVEAARSNAEAETLATLAGSLLRGEHALPALLERVRETFAVQSASLLRRTDGGDAAAAADGSRGSWTCVASLGDHPPLRPNEGDSEAPISSDLVLVLRGRTLGGEDQRVLQAFAAQVAVAYRHGLLAEQAQTAAALSQADRVRTALLNAVSHDLRTPIASAKAAVSSLRGSDVVWSEQDEQALLADADAALDRLTALVTNLLDLSRLQAGALAVAAAPIGLDDVVRAALDHLAAADRVELDVPADLPEVTVDAGLLERVIANLLENAIRHSPAAHPVRVTASPYGSAVELRVIDRGPGIPDADRERVFEAFQRRGDHTSSSGPGVGLGLAIARGFVEAMDGTISLEDTAGGGLTVVVHLPRADTPQAALA
jgi:two-component system sensor histidine kinase KdpD